jgi:hypothetical protein
MVKNNAIGWGFIIWHLVLVLFIVTYALTAIGMPFDNELTNVTYWNVTIALAFCTVATEIFLFNYILGKNPALRIISMILWGIILLFMIYVLIWEGIVWGNCGSDIECNGGGAGTSKRFVAFFVMTVLMFLASAVTCVWSVVLFAYWWRGRNASQAEKKASGSPPPERSETGHRHHREHSGQSPDAKQTKYHQHGVVYGAPPPVN